MKAIQTHTAVIRDDESLADAGEILIIGTDISVGRAAFLVASGCAAEAANDEAAANELATEAAADADAAPAKGKAKA